MALTALDKMNINKYLREHAMGDIYFGDMRNTLGKRKNSVSDVEFLDYFTEYVAEVFRKDEKISVKHVSKVVSCVSAILGWVQEEGQNVSDETLDKIRSFREFYDEYLERTGYEKDDDLYDNYIVVAVNDVNELYPSEVASESVSKYITKVAELEATIKRMEKDINEAIRQNAILQADKDKKSEKIDSLNEDIRSLEKDVRSKAKTILELSESVTSLQERITELSNALNEANALNLELGSFKEKYEELVNEVSRLQGVIDEDIRIKTEEAKKKAKHTNMEALIYQALLFDRINVDGLVRHLKEKKVSTDRSEVIEVLNGMKKIVTLDNSRFSTQPSYKIVQPTLREDGEFEIDVPYGCKHYDVMLVSDMHIREMEGRVLRGYDAMLDYCSKNNINLVLNLGDFYNGTGSHTLEYEHAVQNYKVVEEAIERIPKQDGLYHAVLGGNHDKNVARYGFDPIKMMADAREDFIDLGYTHSTVKFNSPTNYLGCFDIYHPDDFEFPVDVDDDGIDLDFMNDYLEGMYAKQGRSRDDSYIDILGHTHRSQFNYPGGYCYIPEYIDGATKRGACHLRIYFDEDTDIKYMVFMPLGYSTATRLAKNNEIVYQKIKK